jgi:glycosyltransferase involved in cell wall biosynthesis
MERLGGQHPQRRAGSAVLGRFLSEPTVLVGHPFAPIGMGEHLRATFRALRAARVSVRILDVYGFTDPDPDLAAELSPFLTENVGGGNRVFCVNGDEVEAVLDRLGKRAGGGRRIIYPAWELANYPAVWARQLERFEEVWAASHFTYGSLARSVSIPTHHLPLATQPQLRRPLGRRAFGIPEACYVFLFFFDLTSFIERKNPFAALEAFRRVLHGCPGRDIRFVLKLNSSHTRLEDRQYFLDFIHPFRDRVILLDRTMTDAEVKSLHLCCDAFVSLHRSEGYGFGLAEAMFFGRPVVATGYSGNLDFMNADTAFLLDYQLVPVPETAYPHAAGQVWAEPDVEQAADIMIRLVNDPAKGRAVGEAASRRIRTHFSYRAAGLRYAAQLAAK